MNTEHPWRFPWDFLRHQVPQHAVRSVFLPGGVALQKAGTYTPQAIGV